MRVFGYDPIFDLMYDELYVPALSQGRTRGAKAARKNAPKHGVTAELEPRSVRDWYRIIVNDPEAEMPILAKVTQMQERALTLAKSEVGLRRVFEVISEFEQKRDPLFEELANLLHDYEVYYGLGTNRALEKCDRDGFKLLLRIIKRDLRAIQSQINKRTRLLERYKREAMSKQRKAQKAWCDQFKTD